MNKKLTVRVPVMVGKLTRKKAASTARAAWQRNLRESVEWKGKRPRNKATSPMVVVTDRKTIAAGE